MYRGCRITLTRQLKSLPNCAHLLIVRGDNPNIVELLFQFRDNLTADSFNLTKIYGSSRVISFDSFDDSDGRDLRGCRLHWDQLSVIELLAAKSNDEGIATIMLFQKGLRNLRIKGTDRGKETIGRVPICFRQFILCKNCAGDGLHMIINYVRELLEIPDNDGVIGRSQSQGSGSNIDLRSLIHYQIIESVMRVDVGCRRESGAEDNWVLL